MLAVMFQVPTWIGGDTNPTRTFWGSCSRENSDTPFTDTCALSTVTSGIPPQTTAVTAGGRYVRDDPGGGSLGVTAGASGKTRTPYGVQTRTVCVEGDATTNWSSEPIGISRTRVLVDVWNAQTGHARMWTISSEPFGLTSRRDSNNSRGAQLVITEPVVSLTIRTDALSFPLTYSRSGRPCRTLSGLNVRLMVRTTRRASMSTTTV